MGAAATLLELQSETHEDWALAVLEEPLALLSDHAHCELGAAATAQSLITRRPDSRRLVDSMAQLASEEMRHFRRVHALLLELGGQLGPTRANPYAAGLAQRVDRRAPEALLERLIVAAFIERRSHERFELLARVAERSHPPLARLFGELGPAERAHARLFTDLGEALFPGADHGALLRLWAQREAACLEALPFEARLHSGPPSPRPISAPA